MDYREIEKKISNAYDKLKAKRNALRLFIEEFRTIYEEDLKDSEAFSKAREEISSLSNGYDELLHELDELQANCEHDFVWNGHDSHYDYYKCKKCGVVEKW